MPLVLATVAALTMTPAPCPDEFDGQNLHIHARNPFIPDATDMPDTHVEIICRIGPRGRLTDCMVESENPAGWGFGRWMADEANHWRTGVLNVHGCSVVGRRVRIPISSKNR